MRKNVVYLDAGLLHYFGHHAQACRTIRKSFRKQGINPKVVTSTHTTDPRIIRDISPIQHFTTWSYEYEMLHTPLSSEIQSNYYLSMSKCIREFAILDCFLKPAVIFLATAHGPISEAAVAWLSCCRPNNRPVVILEFAHPMEMRVTPQDNTFDFGLLEPEESVMSWMYRSLGARIAAVPSLPVGLVAPGACMAWASARVTGLPVDNLGMPQTGVTNPRKRGGKEVVIGFFGHQRRNKGFHLLPELVPLIMAAHPNVRILVHNGVPEDEKEICTSLDGIAAATGRLETVWGALDAQTYAEVMDRIDLMVLPYQPEVYIIVSSGLHSEALANGIVTVVPAGTSLEMQRQEVAGGGVSFAPWSVDAILSAIGQALEQFDELAMAAWQSASRWGQISGPDCYVDRLLAVAERLGANISRDHHRLGSSRTEA